MQEFQVKSKEAGVRADIFVAHKYPNFTRSALELLFDKKLIEINGKSAKPSAKVRLDDKIVVDESFLTSEPPAIKLPVIYEDDNVTVVHKPPGLLTHSKGVLNIEATVASFIKDKLNDTKLSGNRAGIVHRLDRGTSGVIITAKNAEALSKLQKQFSKRKAKKRYIAVVEGLLEPTAAIIDAPMMRNPAKPQTFKVSSAGKPAITQYEVMKSFKKGSKTYSLVDLRPQTGRTHQLRVHMAYVGHPIVGDHIYGREQPGGMLLHALSLEITLPNSERRIFEAEIPSTIKEFADV